VRELLARIYAPQKRILDSSFLLWTCGIFHAVSRGPDGRTENLVIIGAIPITDS